MADFWPKNLEKLRLEYRKNYLQYQHHFWFGVSYGNCPDEHSFGFLKKSKWPTFGPKTWKNFDLDTEKTICSISIIFGMVLAMAIVRMN